MEPTSSIDVVSPESNAENPPTHFNGGNTVAVTKRKKKKKTWNATVPEPHDEPPPRAQSAASSSSSRSVHRGHRVSSSRRNPRFLVGSARQGTSGVEALALPLGMSIAAVVSQVLERKAATREEISVDHLCMVCCSAVKESLAHVYGDKFNCFARNFEKSFRSTLMTLRLINQSSVSSEVEQQTPLIRENSFSNSSSPLNSSRISNCENDPITNDFHLESFPRNAGSYSQRSNLDEINESIQIDSANQQVVMHGSPIMQQLTCIPHSPRALHFANDRSIRGTLERSVTEQVRSNDLKAYEIGLIKQKLLLKERQLSLNSDANLLERWKLSFGFSKASFRVEKFKNQVEDTRHTELRRSCVDCLVAGLLIMLSCIGYGTYVYASRRITEATDSCTSTVESSKSWWTPKAMSSFSSGLHILRCQVQVVSRMLFGVFMILAIAYLLIQRSQTSNQTMPITFILLLLGVLCGTAGKFCIDTLGGSGYVWLLYWEAFCLLHFLSSVFISALFFILHGPITISEGIKHGIVFPYWMRRFLFYSFALFVLPASCGLMPFAGPGEWKDHFYSLAEESVEEFN